MVKKQAFFKSYFGTITSHLKCMNATTDTPQPIGNKNGYKVACQRIDNYLHTSNDYTNIIMAIESYLDMIDNVWYDKCVVVLRWKDTIVHMVSDTLVALDNTLIPMLFQNSKELPLGRDTTLGSIIADVYNVSSDNWYDCFNRFDRVHHIMETLNNLLNSQKMKQLIIGNAPLYLNFPKKGIEFSDIISMFSDTLISSILMYMIRQEIKTEFPYDYIVGLESRGFIIGSMIARDLGCGFVAIRKEGKLPGETYKVSYEKEYGKDVFEIQKNVIKENARILVVDDILATGGTLMAAKELLSNFKPHCIDYFVMEDVLGTFKTDDKLTILFS
jgi:adenine phosphoribosyltransferase